MHGSDGSIVCVRDGRGGVGWSGWICRRGGLDLQFERGLLWVLQIPHVRVSHHNRRHARTAGLESAKQKVVTDEAVVDLPVHVGFEFLHKVSPCGVPQPPVSIVRTGKYFEGCIVGLLPDGNGRNCCWIVLILVVVILIIVVVVVTVS